LLDLNNYILFYYFVFNCMVINLIRALYKQILKSYFTLLFLVTPQTQDRFHISALNTLFTHKLC